MNKNSIILAASALALTAGASAQTTLEIDVFGGAGLQPVVFVQPGDTVFYSVTGLLGGDPSMGLAMFAFDLSFDGGDLTQAIAPQQGPMLQFVAPQGFNNPAGYGGTVVNGDLIQVGGAMNTIANTFAPAPMGSVVTGLGNGFPVDLAFGSLVAPAAAGTYTLSIENVFANALESQDPSGFWHVTPAEAAAPGDLTIVVLDCGAQPYCAGKENSAGCVPYISSTGTASYSAGVALTLTAHDVLNQQIGLFVYSTAPGSSPLYGATLCVGGTPTRLIEPATSGGSGAPGSNCSGEYVRTIDAVFLTNAGLNIGDLVFCQWVYRDPANPDGTGAGLTNAAAFMVCP